MAFKVGDTVVLKSGGRKMTVTEVHKNDVFRCSWIVGYKVMAADFPGESLEAPKEKPRPQVTGPKTG